MNQFVCTDCKYTLSNGLSILEARRLQEEEERKQREEEERRAQEERERLQAIEDARFVKETAALDVWLVHQKDCFDEWKAEQWKEIQVTYAYGTHKLH